ncbi:MAG: hypothetical protein IE933_07630 [Sphingomonadales bacterium]|nr:hypothetical protein [Sphingomonadales bacterium]MBD3773822.1 hypothetical protein [Paracoccaceae bacterium]
MLVRVAAKFWRDDNAAIGPMYALALFGLIVVAGVGWDYGRLMAMDSELQNAADQAALAAASQLNGADGAMERARGAANDYLATSTSQWANETKLANDGKGTPITGLNFKFYKSYDRVNDTFGDEVTDDEDAAEAKVVQVTVDGREAFYALTAVGGLLSSGLIQADAVAGLDSAVCKAPKMFVCAPTHDFPTDADKGKGLLLHTLPSVADPMAPGNFGFLDPNGNVKDDHDKGNPNHDLGKNNELSGCIASTGINSEPGFVTPEVRALNTRVDIYGPSIPNCDPSTGNFCPSENTVSTFVYKTVINGAGKDPATEPCPSTKGNEIALSDALAEMTSANPNATPGFTRDDCMVAGTCSTLGTGNWNGQAYMNANHGGASLLSVSDGTRYGVYSWELLDKTARLGVRKLGYRVGTGGSDKSAIYCAYPRPVEGTAVVPSATQKDRRILTVASVDCTGLSGRDKLDVLRWMDLFLVDGSRTTGPGAGDIMTEVIGPAKKPGGGYAFQFYGRTKPVLLR